MKKAQNNPLGAKKKPFLVNIYHFASRKWLHAIALGLALAGSASNLMALSGLI